MSIKKFTKNSSPDSDQIIYSDSFRRSIASGIDMVVVLFARAVLVQLIGSMYLDRIWKNFFVEFYDKFGTETVKRTPEHIAFLVHHQIFYITLLSLVAVLLLGAFYHAYLNSSLWQATIGKRVMKIVIVKGSYNSKLSFNLAILHYFLSLVPFIFIFYLLNYQFNHNLSFFETITDSALNLFFGFLFIFWVQIHLFTRKKTTAYDLICNTFLINGKTDSKLPWKK